MSTVFYAPGKCGDALHQWAVPFWWHRKNKQPFEMWIDEPTCKMLKPLLEAQPGVDKVVLVNWSKNYNCGGQPWQGDFTTEQYAEHHIICLGLRAFPMRQLTLQCFEDVPLTLEVDQIELAETPTLVTPMSPQRNRVILHGTGVCQHNRRSPQFWRFLASIRNELERDYDEIVFVGSQSDREVGMTAYGSRGPKWLEFDDRGNFLELASYIKASRLVLACGSVVAALAGQLKVPCIRVHDPIGEAPRVIWDNLGSNQLNRTELELRTEWPEFRQHILGVSSEVVHNA